MKKLLFIVSSMFYSYVGYANAAMAGDFALVFQTFVQVACNNPNFPLWGFCFLRRERIG